MKTWRIILLILGCLFFLIQAIAYLDFPSNIHPDMARIPYLGVAKIIYFLGYSLCLVLTITCFLLAYSLKKKIRREKRMAMAKSMTKN